MNEGGQEWIEQPHCGQSHPCAIDGKRSDEVLQDNAAATSGDAEGLVNLTRARLMPCRRLARHLG